MSELKFKLVKSEQEVTTLEQSVSFDQLYALCGDNLMFVVCVPMFETQQVTLFVTQVIRLEGQVIRYKSAAENSEKIEDELKVEKRKLQREVKFHSFLPFALCSEDIDRKIFQQTCN